MEKNKKEQMLNTRDVICYYILDEIELPLETLQSLQNILHKGFADGKKDDFDMDYHSLVIASQALIKQIIYAAESVSDAVYQRYQKEENTQ